MSLYKTIRAHSQNIGIWIAHASELQQDQERLISFLSLDERKKSTSFHFEKDRNRYVLSRGMLREVLGQYLSIPPTKLIFTYNAYGKPLLAYPTNNTVQFNISHSENIISLIVGKEKVGIDVEYLRPGINTDPLVYNYFSATEVKEYFQLLPEQRQQYFFRLWVRKESFIKAVGLGLHMSLKSFSVLGPPFAPISVVAANSSHRYDLIDLDIGDNTYSTCYCLQRRKE